MTSSALPKPDVGTCGYILMSDISKKLKNLIQFTLWELATEYTTGSNQSGVSGPIPPGLQCSRVFCPPRLKVAFTEAGGTPGERRAYLVARKSRLDCGPRTGSRCPQTNTMTVFGLTMCGFTVILGLQLAAPHCKTLCNA